MKGWACPVGSAVVNQASRLRLGSWPFGLPSSRLRAPLAAPRLRLQVTPATERTMPPTLRLILEEAHHDGAATQQMMDQALHLEVLEVGHAEHRIREPNILIGRLAITQMANLQTKVVGPKCPLLER